MAAFDGPLDCKRNSSRGHEGAPRFTRVGNCWRLGLSALVRRFPFWLPCFIRSLCQQSNPVFDSLTENAYGIYLVHYAFVSGLQLVLLIVCPRSVKPSPRGVIVLHYFAALHDEFHFFEHGDIFQRIAIHGHDVTPSSGLKSADSPGPP
jgi:hypothetical protein